MTISSYNNLNNLSETTFIAGEDKEFIYTVYDDDGITLLHTGDGGLQFSLCPYGDFGNVILTRMGIRINANKFMVYLTSDETLTLTGKYIQQITVVDSLGKTFKTGQGNILVSSVNS